METAEQAVAFAHKAIEMHGGNGYIEDFVTPRLLRDAQVLTVWEGTANILGLEVLRLIEKYDGDQVFAKEMLDQLSGLGDNKWADKIKTEISQLNEKLKEIKSLPYDLQTYYSKNIAKWLVDIFESIVAIEMLQENDERQKAIAEIFLENVWQVQQIIDQPKNLSHFHKVM